MSFVSLFDQYEITTSENSSYSPAANQETVVALVEKATGTHYKNGECVRLEGFSVSNNKAFLSLAKANFYDLIASNIALLNYDKILAASSQEEIKTLDPLLKIHKLADKPCSVQDVIKRDYLSNILAISCMLVDLKGICLLVKRSKQVGIGGNHISVSVTGSVEPIDLNKSDPLIACCQRECSEELAISVPSECITPIGIACGEKKLQPIALFKATVKDLNSLTANISTAQDYSFENSGYVLCHISELKDFLIDPNTLITEAGRIHFEELAR